MRGFTEKLIDEGFLIGHYYVTFFRKYRRDSSIKKTYGEGLISVSKAQFQKYSSHCSHKFTESNLTKKKAWIVAVLWSITRYINNYNYLPGDTYLPNDRFDNAINANCALAQNRKVRTDAAATSYNSLNIRSLCPIAIG